MTFTNIQTPHVRQAGDRLLRNMTKLNATSASGVAGLPRIHDPAALWGYAALKVCLSQYNLLTNMYHVHY